jgi:hypothetical protein
LFVGSLATLLDYPVLFSPVPKGGELAR